MSIATVSRALTTPEKVSGKTLKKVLAQVERSRYKPNLLARNFRSKRTYCDRGAGARTSPIRSLPRSSAASSRSPNSTATRFCSATPKVAKIAKPITSSLVETRQADGLIQLRAAPAGVARGATGTTTSRSSTLANTSKRALPQACGIDNAAAAREHDRASARARPSTHRRDSRTGMQPTDPRSPAAVIALALRSRRESATRTTLIATGDFSHDVRPSRRRRTVQIAASTDRGVLLQRRDGHGRDAVAEGRRHAVPHDVSVAGFDDIEFASFSDPPLTTIEQPTQEIGSQAMSLLLEILNGHKPSHTAQALPTKLIVRNSTAPPPEADGARARKPGSRRASTQKRD